MGKERRASDQSPPPTVLVVDDSATVRAVVRRILQAEGIRVLEASDGREAVTYATIEHPDLVLLDIDMPEMDGLATLAAMQRDERLRSCPVVMLTAHTDAAEVAAALDGGAQDYLRKPSAAVEIVARVRKALNLQQRENVLRRRAEELGEISSHDPLTGLGNRRLMSQWLADRTVPGARLGAFLVDLDRFKQVNDTEGHLVGDRVLIQMAARLAAVTDTDQLLVRWGGEEFLVLVMDPHDGTLASTAATIWRAIGDRPFDIGSGRALRVTASVGVATGALDDLGDVLQRADQALYAAKEQGRDRYVIAG